MRTVCVYTGMCTPVCVCVLFNALNLERVHVCVNYEHSADSAAHAVLAVLLRVHFQLRAAGGHRLTEHTHTCACVHIHPRLYLS